MKGKPTEKLGRKVRSLRCCDNSTANIGPVFHILKCLVRNIRSVLHNFCHSFVLLTSFQNIFESEYFSYRVTSSNTDVKTFENLISHISYLISYILNT